MLQEWDVDGLSAVDVLHGLRHRRRGRTVLSEECAAGPLEIDDVCSQFHGSEDSTTRRGWAPAAADACGHSRALKNAQPVRTNVDGEEPQRLHREPTPVGCCEQLPMKKQSRVEN